MRPLIFSLALMAGCSVSTQAVRDSGKVESITVPAPYQQVYRQISGELRRCWDNGMFTATNIVHSELFTDIRRGEISVKLHSGVGTSTGYVVDVAAIDDSTTRVDVYTRHPNDSATPVRQILDGQKICESGR